MKNVARTKAIKGTTKRKGDFMWKCPNCKKEFKKPIKKHIKFWRRGYHFFMFCPYCRVEIFSDGKLFLAEEEDRICEVTKATGI